MRPSTALSCHVPSSFFVITFGGMNRPLIQTRTGSPTGAVSIGLHSLIWCCSTGVLPDLTIDAWRSPAALWRMTHTAQRIWLAFSVSVMGLSVVALEPEHREHNWGLDVKDGDSKPQDGVEDAWKRLKGWPWIERPWHVLKNLAHEWAKSNVRRAVKVLGAVIVGQQFIIFAQAVAIILLVLF